MSSFLFRNQISTDFEFFLPQQFQEIRPSTTGEEEEAMAVSTTFSETEKFNLFKLPREVRDAIYDNMLVSDTTKQILPGTTVKRYNIVPNNILALSRQFHTELMKRAKALASITIYFRGYDEMPTVPKLQGRDYVRHVEVDFLLRCMALIHNFRGSCIVEEEFICHHDWLKSFLEPLKTASTVSVSLYIDSQARGIGCEDEILQHHQVFTSLRGFGAFNVYLCDRFDDSCDFAVEKELVMTYSKEEKGLVRVDQVVGGEGEDEVADVGS